MQKKWVIGITAMSLVATTAIGSTLAYFTTQTQQMKNTFTVAAPNGVTAQLRESKWDGYDFGQYETKGLGPWAPVSDPDGQQANPWVPYNQAASLGINQAKIMLPGAAIKKNPTMKNTTNWNQWGGWNHQGALNWGQPNVPVYMAMKVDTVNINNATPNIDESKSGWKKLNNSLYTFNKKNEVGDIYLWCGSSKDLIAAKDLKPAAVNSGEQTNALFDTVTIAPEAIQNTSVKGSNAGLELKNFEIQVQGAAVQVANMPNVPTIEAQLVSELGAKMK